MAGGCFSCCGKRDEAPKKLNPLRGTRVCRDLLCCIIFVGFIGLLLAIFALGIAAGDWQAVLYDSDYLGDRCGTGGRGSKAYYPRIPQDLLEQPDIIATQQYWNLELYTLCVDSCPGEFNIQNPSLVPDYGWTSGAPNNPTTTALGSGSRPEWVSATPTSEILNRCVPRINADSSEESMCAYPNCTHPDAVAVGAVCTSNPDFGASWPISTTAQQSVCRVEARQTQTMQYQISASDDASAAALASIAEVVGGFFEVVTSLREGIWFILAFGILAPIVIAVLYMVLLYLFTRIIIYGLLTLLVLVELVATFICFARSGLSIAGLSGADIIDSVTTTANQSLPDVIGDALGDVDGGSNWMYTAAFWILVLITLITVVTIVLWRKKIAICAAIIKEATTVFKDVPTLMIFPVFTSMVQVIVCCWFIIGFIMMRTTRAESYDLALGVLNTTSVDPIDGFLRDLQESGNLRTAMAVVHLYGFYTVYQWVSGMSWTTMSMTCSWWYYFKGDEENKSFFPLGRSLYLTTVFHAGSVAFAAFIIALFDLLRTIVAYVQRQMEAAGQGNMVMRIAFFCIGCCIGCIRRTVKMISYYGLVFVASNGHSFCYACAQTAFFFTSHAGQVTVNGIVIWLIRMISVLTAPITCAIIGFYACDAGGVDNAMYPAFATFCCAVLMTTACMNVFDCTITTIFVCCFEDQEKYGSQYMLQPHHKALAAVFHKKKGKEATPGKETEKAGLVEVEA